MSLNNFEIILESAVDYNPSSFLYKVYNDDFRFFKPNGIPKGYSIHGVLSLIEDETQLASNYNFVNDWFYGSSLHNNEKMFDSFQTPDTWTVLYNSVFNHGMNQGKTVNSEDTDSNSYPYTADYEGEDSYGKIRPGLNYVSRSNSNLGDNLLETDGLNWEFTDGSLTDWNLATGAVDETDGVADYADVSSSTVANLISISYSSLDNNKVYAVSFSRVSGTDPFFVRVFMSYQGRTVSIDSTISSTSGVETFYFTTFTPVISLSVNLDPNTSGNRRAKLDYIKIQEVFSAERIGDEDDFSHIPEMGSNFALHSSGIYSIDPDNLLNYGSYESLNIFGDENSQYPSRSISTQGTYGDASRTIEIFSDDTKMIESLHNNEVLHYDPNLSNYWFWSLIGGKFKVAGRKDFSTNLPPAALKFNHVVTPYNTQSGFLSFELNGSVPLMGTPSQQMSDTYPDFNDSSNYSIADELLLSPNFETPSDWNGQAGWTISEGVAELNSNADVTLSQTKYFDATKDYIVYLKLETDRTLLLYFSSNSESEYLEVSESGYYYIKPSSTSNQGINIKTKHPYGTATSATINTFSIVEASKLNVEKTISNVSLIYNNEFTSGTDGWTGDTGVIEWNPNGYLRLRVKNTSGDNFFSTVDNILENGETYILRYTPIYIGDDITSFKVSNGSSFVSIPMQRNKQHEVAITYTSSSDEPLTFKFTGTDLNEMIMFNDISLESARDVSDIFYIDSTDPLSQKLTVKPFHGLTSFQARISRFKLLAGQEYRFVLNEASATSLSYYKLKINFVDESGNVASKICEISSLETYSNGDGSENIKGVSFICPKTIENNLDNPYVNVVLSLEAEFFLDSGSVQFEYFNFKENCLQFAERKEGCLGYYNSDRAIMCELREDGSPQFNENYSEIATHDDNFNISINKTESESDIVDILSNENLNILDYRKFFENKSTAFGWEGNSIIPKESCPVDDYGFYTGGYFTKSVKLSLYRNRKLSLYIYPNNYTSDEPLLCRFNLNSIKFKTSENAYITKSPSVTDAIRFYYNPSLTDVEPPILSLNDSEKLASFFPHYMTSEKPKLLVSWDIQSLTGSGLIISFGGYSKILITSSGSGSQLLEMDGFIPQARVAKADEIFTTGVEALTNNSFVSDTNWTVGSQWSHVSYFQAYAVATALSEEPSADSAYGALALTQQGALTVGVEYEVKVTVAVNPGGILEGGVIPILGSTSTTPIGELGLLTEDYTTDGGTYTYRGIAEGTDFRILASYDFVGFLTEVSVKQVYPLVLSTTTVELNSLNFSLPTDVDTEIKSAKWGDESSNNENLKSLAPNGYNMPAYSSGIRVYSVTLGTENLAALSDSSQYFEIKTSDITDISQSDTLTLEVSVPYLNLGNEVEITHELTAPGVVTTETITTQGTHTFNYNTSYTSKENQSISIKFTQDGTNPLNTVLEYFSINGRTSGFVSEEKKLDLKDDFSMSYTLSKKDFNNLDKISGDFSKTISVPATSNNIKSLDFASNLNTLINLNQKNGFPCTIKTGGINSFKGVLFLSETNKDEHGETSLELTFRSGNSSWAEALKTKRLRDLNSASYPISIEEILGNVELNEDPTSNQTLIKVSENFEFKDFLNKEIVFPLIDNGRLQEDIDGNKFIGFENIKAAYRISNVVQKIFNECGYTLESSFFNGGSEWEENISSEFSSYVQNLVGIAPSMNYTDEEVAKSEVDLTFNSDKAFREDGYNAARLGVEYSRAKLRGGKSLRPRMGSLLLNQSYFSPVLSYYCDYAFIRFNKVNVDSSKSHSYYNVQSTGFNNISEKQFNNANQGNILNTKTDFYGNKEKSSISVKVSGYYDLSCFLKFDFESNSSFSIFGLTEKRITAGLLKREPSSEDYYKSRDSYGSEFFDLQEGSSIPLTKSYTSARVSISRTQYLEAGEDYDFVVLQGTSGFSQLDYSLEDYFSVEEVNINLKLSKNPAPLKGKNNVIYNYKGDPKVSYKNVLPDVSCLDFITELSKAFNLVWDVDEQAKKVITEPFEDFYRINGSEVDLTETPVFEAIRWIPEDPYQSFEDNFGYIFPPYYGNYYPTWSGSQGKVYSDFDSIRDISMVRLEPLQGDSIPSFYLKEEITVVKGGEYVFSFYYETNSPLKVLVGSEIGSNSYGEQLIHGSLSQSLTENDYSREVYKIRFRASSTTLRITFQLPLGSERAEYQEDNPDADVVVNAYNYHKRFASPEFQVPLYSMANVGNFSVRKVSNTYTDWTEKSLITNVKENSIIQSNLNFKMKEDSSDYEINLEKSGSKSSLFGDKFVETGFTKDAEDTNVSLSIFAPLKMNYSNLILKESEDTIFIPRIWGTPNTDFEPITNEQLPTPNNSHEHKLAVIDGVKTVPSGKLSYGLNYIWKFPESPTDDLFGGLFSEDGRFAVQNVEATQYLSATSYSPFDEDSPNLTFSSDFSKGLSKSLYDVYHSPLINMLSLRDKIVSANVHLTSSDISSLDFRNLVHIDGNVYIINKIKDFNFSGEPTEVELLLVTPIK